jgi:hypothetical protein
VKKNENLNEGFKGTKADPKHKKEQKKSIWKIKNCIEKEGKWHTNRKNVVCVGSILLIDIIYESSFFTTQYT